MKARHIIDGASYGPKALKVIGRAFDEAWASIAGNYRDGVEKESARIKLARAVLDAAGKNSRNAVALKNAALQAIKNSDRASNMSRIIDNPKHWRDRAKETRALLGQSDNPDTKRILLEIAGRYELLAEIADLGS